jgi:hypothetical protein
MKQEKNENYEKNIVMGTKERKCFKKDRISHRDK